MPESPEASSNGNLPSVGNGVDNKFTDRLFVSNGGGGDAGNSQELLLLERHLTSSNTKLAKKFIRDANWPPNHSVRQQLWLRLCKRLTSDGEFKNTLLHYRSTLAEVCGKGEKSTRNIPLPGFVQDSLVNHYFLNEEGINRCRKILAMIEVCQPQIICAPPLYPLTALFLHFNYEDAEVFACLEAILTPKRVARKFMPETTHAWNSASHVMAELVRRRLKAVYNFILHSTDASGNVEFFDSWLKWIFVDLPFDVVIRVVDCYLYEGMKVLFRVGLAILKLFHKSLGQPHSVPNLAHSISQFCQKFSKNSSSAELLKVGFSFSRLSQNQLLLMIKQYEGNLDDGQIPISNYKIPIPFVPLEFAGISQILTEDQFYAVWQWLPPRHRIAKPQLLYTSEEHGVSLVTFFQQTNGFEPTIIIVRTRQDEIFGAFCSHSWDNRLRGGKNLSYFGSGETFLFTLVPNQNVYTWVGVGSVEPIASVASLFMAGDSSCLIIGGGGGFAIRFDSTLSHGRSEACLTFSNPPLCSTKDGDFECSVVEVFGFLV